MFPTRNDAALANLYNKRIEAALRIALWTALRTVLFTALRYTLLRCNLYSTLCTALRNVLYTVRWHALRAWRACTSFARSARTRPASEPARANVCVRAHVHMYFRNVRARLYKSANATAVRTCDPPACSTPGGLVHLNTTTPAVSWSSGKTTQPIASVSVRHLRWHAPCIPCTEERKHAAMAEWAIQELP